MGTTFFTSRDHTCQFYENMDTVPTIVAVSSGDIAPEENDPPIIS